MKLLSILISCCLYLQIQCAFCDFPVKAKVSKTSAEVGESITIEIKTTFKGQRDIKFPKVLEIEGFDFIGRTAYKNIGHLSSGPEEINIYRIIGKKEGTYTIPAIEIFVDEHKLTTESFTVDIIDPITFSGSGKINKQGSDNSQRELKVSLEVGSESIQESQKNTQTLEYKNVSLRFVPPPNFVRVDNITSRLRDLAISSTPDTNHLMACYVHEDDFLNNDRDYSKPLSKYLLIQVSKELAKKMDGISKMDVLFDLIQEDYRKLESFQPGEDYSQDVIYAIQKFLQQHFPKTTIQAPMVHPLMITSRSQRHITGLLIGEISSVAGGQTITSKIVGTMTILNVNQYPIMIYYYESFSYELRLEQLERVVKMTSSLIEDIH